VAITNGISVAWQGLHLGIMHRAIYVWQGASCSQARPCTICAVMAYATFSGNTYTAEHYSLGGIYTQCDS